MNPITEGILILLGLVAIFYIVGLIRSLTPKYRNRK